MEHSKSDRSTRRDFLKMTAALPLAASLGGRLFADKTSGQAASSATEQGSLPWYQRTYRWGQINLNESDPRDFDLPWWRDYWRRTQTQGLVINAGGIVAFYPSKEPLQHQAQFLDGRDLYGDLTRAAHADGLIVFARMDCGSAFEPFYQAHPDWFARNAAGEPYKSGSAENGVVLYTTCINGPYYDEYIPRILKEIVAHERPEGFTDNHWAGLGRESMCYCSNCKTRFRQYSGEDLPATKNWNDPVYRQWIEWNYKRRLEIWDLFTNTTKAAGGPDCIWSGMLSGNFVQSAASFRDMKELCGRAAIMMLDHQGRANNGLGPPGIGQSEGFQENGDTGKRVHGLGGWNKLSPESMATYGPRKAARPTAEVRLWMLDGIAGSIQPWWHHIGGYQEDRRVFHVVEPVYRWYTANQQYLVNRLPVASVGVVYSQRNFEWYGRDNADVLALAPYDGVVQALIRARIPYLPIHADFIDRDALDLAALILPNLAAMADTQVEAVRRYVSKGGSLIVTDETSLYDNFGDRRPDFALADVLGAHYTGKQYGPKNPASLQHTYLRLTPDLGQDKIGPRHGDEPAHSTPRHPVLHGFDETNLITFGGILPEVKAAPGAEVLLTFVPEFPVLPPEEAWMRVPRTTTPGLIVKEQGGARIAYLPADIDRRYQLGNIPDHGDLLANLVRWAAKEDIPVWVEGPGLMDCHLYRQGSRMILHIVNLTNTGAWRIPTEELIPVGPITVKLKLPAGALGKNARMTVSGNTAPIEKQGGWARFELKSVLDHEVIVVE
jgi:Hypothetical glycosyl hydrolase 6